VIDNTRIDMEVAHAIIGIERALKKQNELLEKLVQDKRPQPEISTAAAQYALICFMPTQTVLMGVYGTYEAARTAMAKDIAEVLRDDNYAAADISVIEGWADNGEGFTDDVGLYIYDGRAWYVGKTQEYDWLVFRVSR